VLVRILDGSVKVVARNNSAILSQGAITDVRYQTCNIRRAISERKRNLPGLEFLKKNINGNIRRKTGDARMERSKLAPTKQ
jgi:hypothetical protein